MKFILGKKIEMTQVWKDGNTVGVTKVEVGPCTVVQVKNDKKDGYTAVQVGYGVKKEKNIKKPQIGHFKGLDNFRYLKEFRVKNEEVTLKRGDRFDIGSFEVGDAINFSAVSKGKGFQGVVKRHGFAGQIKTHGTKDQVRMPGSIGATGPAHVFKGTRMGGRMGGDQVTFNGGEIIDIDVEKNILYIKGGVPGARNTLVSFNAPGEIKVLSEETSEKEEDKKTEDTPANLEQKKEEDVSDKKKVEEKKEEVVNK